MSEGFLIDRGDADRKRVQEWIEGEPVRSIWTGIKTRGLEAYTVATWRCDKCGYLASFATERTD